MPKSKILIQLDTDPQPSVFDGVVAVDAGVEQLFQYGGVTEDQVQGLVHGAMFTRGPADLHNTAVFIGGSDVALGEQVLSKAVNSFFGPVRVSLMMDASGANTTAAGAVVAAGRHLDLSDITATVLAATGPVGQRVARLLAAAGSQVRVASREMARAEELAAKVASAVGGQLIPVETSNADQAAQAVIGADLIVAAGAAGVELLDAAGRAAGDTAKVMIDLNAVPPAGIAGIDVMDKAKDRDGVICYGAIGVGGTKMKIHKAAIRRIFERNDCVLDIDEIYQLGLELESN